MGVVTKWLSWQNLCLFYYIIFKEHINILPPISPPLPFFPPSLPPLPPQSTYLAELADDIVKESMRLGSRDNITTLVVHLRPPGEGERRALFM